MDKANLEAPLPKLRGQTPDSIHRLKIQNLPWLAEFHRQWLAVRGRSPGIRSRVFSRDWTELLESAGIRSAEDTATAVREAEGLEAQGRLALKRHRYRRYLIERVALPLESEPWLHGLFSSKSPDEKLAASRKHLEEAAMWRHSTQPVRWMEWCSAVDADFSRGVNHGPMKWRSPEAVREILHLVHSLTSHDWPEATLIREASVRIGLDSKGLESRQRVVEAALGSFFGQPTPLEALGILSSESRAMLAGKICLHFHEGPPHVSENLRSPYHLTSDVERASHATTPATRVIMVENTKTTLRRLAAMNHDGSTLLVGCAFPTRGVRRLLELLPQDLPLFHFGDTDPAGFHILGKLREAAGREVAPWMMQRRLKAETVPLTDYDRRLLPGLLENPWLADVRPLLHEILESGDKGDFEQETLELELSPGDER